jgi:hypothetical protein
LSRIVTAFRVFFRSLGSKEFAERAGALLEPAPAAGPDLRILAVLQRDGRLVDFLMEEIDGYSDAQVGAAVRDIHRSCRKALREHVTLEPVLSGAEESTVQVPAGFDPAAIRLVGNVAGKPPFSGVLKHHGWKVGGTKLPALPRPAQGDAVIVAPAEVEIA